jgi:hypothetical protein
MEQTEIMSSPFEKQLRDHNQVTQYIFRVKEDDSKKKQAPKYFDDAPSDYKMAKIPVHLNFVIHFN